MDHGVRLDFLTFGEKGTGNFTIWLKKRHLQENLQMPFLSGSPRVMLSKTYSLTISGPECFPSRKTIRELNICFRVKELRPDKKFTKSISDPLERYVVRSSMA
jgi:hypothetical protein